MPAAHHGGMHAPHHVSLAIPAAPLAPSRCVVDAATRMLHWLMALAFTAAYLTADGERWRLGHVTLGIVHGSENHRHHPHHHHD